METQFAAVEFDKTLHLIVSPVEALFFPAFSFLFLWPSLFQCLMPRRLHLDRVGVTPDRIEGSGPFDQADQRRGNFFF